MGKCSADIPVAIEYTGTIPKTMNQPIVKNYVADRFNAAADILKNHGAEIDLATLETPAHTVAGSVPVGHYKSFTKAMKAVDFAVHNKPRARCDSCTCSNGS